MSLQDGKQCPHCGSYMIASDFYSEQPSYDEHGIEYFICMDCYLDKKEHGGERLYFGGSTPVEETLTFFDLEKVHERKTEISESDTGAEV